jgi:hypothetical protein
LNKESEAAKQSGYSFIKDGWIYWNQGNSNLLTLEIDKIKVIGEYSTEGGPFVDDWFIVFVMSIDEVNQISAHAEGLEKVLKELSESKGTGVVGSLFYSTQWKTNVIWPKELEGQELFELVNLPPKNRWERLKIRIGLGSVVESHLTEELKQYLRK